MFCFGPYGLRASEVNCCSYPYGRMGQNTILAKPHRLRIPQFACEVTYRLGFVSTRKPPFLPIPPIAAPRSPTATMANRGGGNPNRGRGTHGAGGSGWQDGLGEVGVPISMKGARVVLPVKEQTRIKVVIIRTMCLVMACSALVQEGRTSAEEIGSTRVTIIAMMCVEILDIVVIIIPVVLLQTILQMLGLVQVMAGMLPPPLVLWIFSREWCPRPRKLSLVSWQAARSSPSRQVHCMCQNMLLHRR
jgi:hypothetical protein